MVKNIGQSILAVDQRLFLRLATISNKKFADGYFRFMTRSADGYVYVLYGLTLFLIGDAISLDMLAVAAAAFGMQIPLYLLIKNVVRRKRPFEKLVSVARKVKAPDRYSFPSGHTACAFLFGRLIVLHVVELWPLMLFWALSVAVSRVYLRVHFPGDVLAGALLGLASAETALYMFG